MIPFSKYSAAGNDFILMDNRKKIVSSQQLPSLARFLCHRHEGIGADGVLLWEPPEPSTEFSLRIFNADGSEVPMCGNGLRAFVQFLKEKGVERKLYHIENVEKKCYQASFSERGVKVAMPPPSSLQWNISLENYFLHSINTGVPHAVVFVEDIEKTEVDKWGRHLRSHPFFGSLGTNVNFVAVRNNGLQIRTYERGVEAETLACGTGSVASALVAAFIYDLKPPIQIQVRSKAYLFIDFHKQKDQFSQITMEGPAKKVFEGFFSPPF